MVQTSNYPIYAQKKSVLTTILTNKTWHVNLADRSYHWMWKWFDCIAKYQLFPSVLGVGWQIHQSARPILINHL